MTVDIGLYSTKLNPKMALIMAQLSKEAYKAKPNNNAPDESAILASLKQNHNGFIAVYGTSKDSAQAVFIEHEDYFCMAFRGTDEWRDWFDNIDGRKANSEKAMFGDFHRGFYRSCNDVWDYLDNIYDKKKKQIIKRVSIAHYS